MDEGITYERSDRWKYRLVAPYVVSIPLVMDRGISSPGEYIILDGGKLSLKQGYAWDGPSGPVIDTRALMRPSVVHDALYQLMREALLDLSYRGLADDIFRTHCLEDGVSRLRARRLRWGLKVFGEKYARPTRPSPILRAP